MVKITTDLIIKHGSHSKKQNYENDLQFLRRLTHIYLQEKNIDEIVSSKLGLKKAYSKHQTTQLQIKWWYSCSLLFCV